MQSSARKTQHAKRSTQSLIHKPQHAKPSTQSSARKARHAKLSTQSSITRNASNGGTGRAGELFQRWIWQTYKFVTKPREHTCRGNRAGDLQTAILRIVRTPKAEALLGKNKTKADPEVLLSRHAWYYQRPFQPNFHDNTNACFICF